MLEAKNIKTRVSEDFIKQLAGYGLATAEILYRLPDHPRLLQAYIWQDYDIAPDFPTLIKFLNFWTQKLEGPLHSVRVGHTQADPPGRDKGRRRRVSTELAAIRDIAGEAEAKPPLDGADCFTVRVEAGLLRRRRPRRRLCARQKRKIQQLKVRCLTIITCVA